MYNEPEEEQYEPAPLYNFHDLVYDSVEEDTEEQIPTEGEVQEVIEGEVDTEVPEEVGFTYPEYLDPEWVPPADVEDSWYREKYQSIHAMLQSEDLANKLVEVNANRILEQEKDIENFKELYIAHKEGRTDFIRQHFPEELAKIGINPVLKEEEVDSLIQQKLSEEFGEDYEDVFNQKDVIKPTSISAKIFYRSQELHKSYAEENQKREQLIQGYQPQVQEQPVPLDFDKEYEEQFKELPREEYDALVNKLKEDYPKWTLKHLLRAVTYEDDLAKAREEGIAIGKASSTKELRAMGNSKPIARTEQTRRDDDEPNYNNKIYGSDWSDIMRGMIHN